MKKILWLSSLVVVLGACLVQAAAPAASEQQTAAILDHHWKCFTDNDLEGTMADYTDQSVLITPKRTYRGLKEIRENFVSAFTNLPKASSTLKLNKSEVHNDVGYILWEAAGPKSRVSFATDTFVIRHGKILTQTFGGVSGPP